MPAGDKMTRRQAMQAVVAAASATTLTAGASALADVGTPDAEVSYLWREFDVARTAYRMIVESRRRAGRDTDDLEYEAVLDRVDAIVRRVAETPCSTLDGLRIKATIAADPDFGNEDLAMSIVEDLCGEEFGR